MLIFNNISEEEEPRKETERVVRGGEDASVLNVAGRFSLPLTCLPAALSSAVLSCALQGRGARKATSPDWLPP